MSLFQESIVRIQGSRRFASVLAMVLGLVSVTVVPAWAEKPDWAGNGKHKSEQEERHGKRDKGERDERYNRDERRRDGGGTAASVQIGGAGISLNVGAYFGDTQRRAVHDYYAPQFQSGKCPPGLAKKGNGCLPPGQAKKWNIGQRLPAGVVTYPVPAELRVRLGTPPAGHEFVRVAGDILLIAVGTSMVVDAIEDLTR
jgi:Ni/Co efflux regulator RcnB